MRPNTIFRTVSFDGARSISNIGNTT